jgi:hypothetical protein
MSDTQRVRDAIEAAGLQNNGGSGPMYNDKRKDGRRIKLLEAGYFANLPLHVQWLIHDYMVLFFGERFKGMKLKPRASCYGEHAFSLHVYLRDS